MFSIILELSEQSLLIDMLKFDIDESYNSLIRVLFVSYESPANLKLVLSAFSMIFYFVSSCKDGPGF